MNIISMWGNEKISHESIVYKDDVFFIAKLHNKVYLYFCERNGNYYAFNKLSKISKRLIEDIKKVLKGEFVEDAPARFLAENSIKNIKKY